MIPLLEPPLLLLDVEREFLPLKLSSNSKDFASSYDEKGDKEIDHIEEDFEEIKS